jgi:hypothetical protein
MGIRAAEGCWLAAETAQIPYQTEVTNPPWLKSEAFHPLLHSSTKAQFIKVYGPQGPKMAWEQRAEAGVDAKHFQEALKAKGGA